MSATSISLHPFDLIVAVIFIAGFARGKKRGLSEELLDLFKWLAIVVVGAMLYRPVGQQLSRFTGLNLPMAFVIAYLASAIAITLFFSWIKRLSGEKLVQSDLFGWFEYYLGMLGGGLRFACVLLAGLAVLHAKRVTAEELAAQEKMQRENFGSITFPTLASIRHGVFANSYSGQWIEKHLEPQLISPRPFEYAGPSHEGIGERRSRAVEEVLGQSR